MKLNLKGELMKSLMLLTVLSTLALASCASSKTSTAEQNLKELSATNELSESSVKNIGEESEYGLPERLNNSSRTISKGLIMSDSSLSKTGKSSSKTKSTKR
jgi:hypothetical protein